MTLSLLPSLDAPGRYLVADAARGISVDELINELIDLADSGKITLAQAAKIAAEIRAQHKPRK